MRCKPCLADRARGPNNKKKIEGRSDGGGRNKIIRHALGDIATYLLLPQSLVVRFTRSTTVV